MNIKLDKVQEQMLVLVAKKLKMRPDKAIQEIIERSYQSIK